MSKKLLALLLALVMIVGSFTSVLAETTTADDKKAEVKTEEKKDEKSEEKKDEKSEEKTEEKTEEKKEEPAKDEALERAIKVLKKAGFITGYSADSDDFKVEKNVKRSEFASMIVRAMGLEKSAKSLATVPTGFKDVPTNHWANGYIAVAKQQGFVNGYTDGTFRPDRQISYQDMATMLTIALGQAEVGTVYPAGYIVKAQQLGLFNDVKVPAYTDMATRGDVFKMLYNMINCKEFGQRKILKAIVLENPRVENLADRQITVEVLSVVQKADWVDANRATDKRGDQHTYTLDEDAKFDCEGLLGRVVNVTVDKNDKVVDIKVDDTYKYLEGKITGVSPKKFDLDWSTYSVLFDERYAAEDERIFRTYLNDEDYKYEDFVRDYKDGAYDYARITVKNGKVIFIDAYQFDDVAPVAEVKDGKVWYYDDARNARIVKTDNDFPRALSFVSNGVFSVGDIKAIAKDDVIHFYNGYKKAIVRKDARFNEELTKTSEDRAGNEWAHTKDAKYLLKDLNKFRAVYSFEGKEFNTLANRFQLRLVTGEKVKILVALDGTVQLVEGNIAWNDGINGIRKISSKGEVKLIPSNGEEFWAVEGRNTRYYTNKTTNNKQLNELFDVNDIVYYAGESEKDAKDQTISKMVNVLPFTTYSKNMTFASMDSRYIQLGKNKYRYFDNLHAYYLDRWNNLQAIDNVPQFIAENAKNDNLEAYVVTEPELKAKYGKLGIEYFNFLTDAPNVASIVVFNNANYRGKTDVIYAEVNTKFNYVSTVRFIDANGVAYDVDLTDDGIDADQFKQGDIVELHILKDSADKETKVGYVEKVVIDREATRYNIKDLPRNAYEIGKDVKYFDNDTVIFNRQLGDYVQVYYDEDDNNFVRVVRYFKDKGTVAKPAEVVDTLVGKREENPVQIELGKAIWTSGAKGNVWYTVTPRTWFVGKNGIDYGYGLEGLQAFWKDYANVKVRVEVKQTNEYNGKVALKVIGEKTLEDLKHEDAMKAVDKAKEVIEALGKQIYKNTQVPADEFKALVESKLDATSVDGMFSTISPAPNKSLSDYVSLAFATKATDLKNGLFEVTIKDVIEFKGYSQVARNAYYKNSSTEDTEQALNERKEATKKEEQQLLKLQVNFKNVRVGGTAPYTMNDVKPFLLSELSKPEYSAIRAKLTALINANSVSLTPVKDNDYTLAFVYTYADNADISTGHVENVSYTVTVK